MKDEMSEIELPQDRKVMIPLFLGLVAAGLAGNYFHYEMLFSIQFIFGSIFALLALQFLGLRGGITAALLISSSTYPLWNHPYAIVILTAEVAVVGLLHRHHNLPLIIADTLFWIVLGIPLVLFFYYGVMHLPLYNASITLIKQALNGIFNALVARLIYMALAHRIAKKGFALQELIFSLLALFVLLPSLLLLSLNSRADKERTERAVHNALLLDLQRTAPLVDNWLHAHLVDVGNLAWIAATNPRPMVQKALDHARKMHNDYPRMGLLDETATIVAYSPLLDELGQSNIGKNFADRPYIPALRQTLRPMLSEVVMGRLGRPKPMVAALAPVVKNGAYAGYTVGILDLDRVREMIELSVKSTSLPGIQFTLLDRNSKVIVSSRPELKALEPYLRPPGELIGQRNDIFQWLPRQEKNVSISDRWKKALYVTSGSIGQAAEWTLLLEQPMAPFQKQLYERYAAQLAWVFAVLLLAIAIAELASRRFVRSLDKVRAVSTDMPAKLAFGDDITWPESAVMETRALISNFRAMSVELKKQIHETREMNTLLEQRVNERTRELQESEENLKSSLSLLQATLQSTADGILVVADNGRISSFNKQFAELWNIPPSMHGTSDDTALLNFVLEQIDDAGQFIAKVKKLYAEPDASSFDILKFKDGRVFERYSQPQRVDGKPVGRVWSFRDITAQSMATEQIKNMAQELKTVLDTLTVGVSFVRNRRIQWANEAHDRIFGYEHGTTTQLETAALYADEESYRRIGAEGYEQLSKGVGYATEVEMKRRDGATFWASLIGRSVSPGKPAEGSIWMLQDITEHRNTEARMRLLTQAIDEAINGVQVIDLTGNILFANAAAGRIMGYEVHELVGKPVSELNANQELDRTVILPSIKASGHWQGEVLGLRKDGSTVPIWLSTSIVTSEDGKPLAMLAVLIDVTERKLSEKKLAEKTAQLEDLTRHLEQRVQEEIAARRKNEELFFQQAKLAAMGEMLGAISHQWRQPLNALGLIVQNMGVAYEYGELDQAYIDSAVRKAMGQIKHMSKTIDDFRSFFKPDKEETTFDSAQAVGQVLSLMSAQLEANSIHWRLNCHVHDRIFEKVEEIITCPEKTIRGFRNEFEHVVLNLINNGREAILERKLREPDFTEGLLAVDFYHEDNTVIIVVSDNGGGINPGIIDRIFDPYFTTKDPAQGTGIGLYMSKVILDHMHGSLSAKNSPQGAVFTLTMPGVAQDAG